VVGVDMEVVCPGDRLPCF